MAKAGIYVFDAPATHLGAWRLLGWTKIQPMSLVMSKSNLAAVATNINYEAMEMERASEIDRKIAERLNRAKDVGISDHLRHVVLSYIVSGEYDDARRALGDYVGERDSYPKFQERAQRYQRHCIDLIRAIESKRNIQGLGALPLAKQQEVYNKVVEHFEELKQYLKYIEKFEKESRLDDIRSTTWFMKAVVNSVLALFGLAFFLELQSGLASSFHVVFSAFAKDVSDAFFRLIGL